MNTSALDTKNVAAAILVITGGVAVVMPQHAGSAVRVALVSIAAAAGLFTLASNVPESGWLSPFKWMSPFERATGRGDKGAGGETDQIRASLGGWRQPLPHGPGLPPAALRILKPLVGAAVEVRPAAIGRLSDAELSELAERLSPYAFGVLTSDPSERGGWVPKLPPNTPQVAVAVFSLLDEIEALADGPAARSSDDATHHLRVI